MVELIYGQPAIAFQSLYFEYGSQQALHRDPMFVVTDPPMHLLASWVALEDVTPESGPLAYVPGTHRWPWFEFEPGLRRVRPEGSPREAQRAQRLDARDVAGARARRAAVHVPARRRVHLARRACSTAARRSTTPGRRAKSFVTHYCTAANKTSRTASMRVRDGDGWRRTSSTTETVIERDHGRGLDNPFRTPFRK